MDFKKIKNIPNKVLIPLIIAVSFIGGYFARNIYSPLAFDIPKETPTEFSNIENGKPVDLDFSLFWDVYNIVKERHIDSGVFDLVKIRDEAIIGMLRGIGDPFTNYFPPKESQRFLEDIGGKFGGVGIEIGIRDDVLTVIAPLADTPGARAGILAGDVIIAIDDESTADLSLEESVGKIRGDRGTQVKLTINRDGEIKDFEITRAEIKIPAARVTYLEDDSIAHVQLITFNRNIDPEFEKIANEIISKKVDRIILDLRNNPGGLLDSAINISSWFLSSTDIVVGEDFGNGERNNFTAYNNGKLRGKKVVILINKGSASASEIVAGALRDNNNIQLIGQTTFGKGSVQDVSELSNKGSVKFTIARWLTPDGHSIDKTGLVPDVEVELTTEDFEAGEDPQLDKAVEIIKNL